MTKAILPDPAPLAIFGLPFTNGSLKDTTQQCLKFLSSSNKFSIDPCHISAFDASFVTKIFGYLPTSINQSELLSIARHANISLVPSKFLRTLCRCLGSTLTKPVSPAELLNSICREFSFNKMSIFLLGGKDKYTKAAAIKLHDTFNGLCMVGIATPLIFTEGADLINAPERDTLLVEEINATHADMLVVNLGSPKQELWVERVRYQLKTPVIFTIGNLLKTIAEKGAKTTDKPEHVGFFKSLRNVLHKCIQYFKLTCMAIPLVIFHTINRSVFQWFHETDTSTALPKEGRLFLSANRSIAFISLPQLIDETNVAMLKQRIEEASSHDVIVLDFLLTRHIQPEGFHLLMEAWLKRRKQHKEIYGFSPTADIKCLMKVHRTFDLFKDHLCNSPEMLMSRLSTHEEATPFYDTFSQHGDQVIISILGSLGHRIEFDAYLKKISPIIGQKNCFFDLSCCTLIDNTGFAFLLNLRKQLQSQNRSLTLCCVNKALMRQFKSADVDKLFDFSATV